MAYTQEDLDALDLEITEVRLVKSTTFSDQSTTFRDLDELLRLRALMAAALAADTSGSSRTRYAATSKGLR
jgi:hypothetical protein